MVFKLMEHAAANADHPIKKSTLILYFVQGINMFMSDIVLASLPAPTLGQDRLPAHRQGAGRWE
jgi:hypothetical protein